MNRLPVFASVVVASAVLFAALPASAAEPAAPGDAAKNLSVGGDLAVTLPVGNLADVAGLGLGALVRVDYRVIDTVSVGGRAGFIYNLSKDAGSGSFGISEAPIFGAARYHFLGREVNGPYAALELGPVLIFSRATVLGASASDSTTKLGTSLGGGYQIGKIDLRASLLVLDVGHLGDTMSLMANVGYSFL